MYSGGEFKACSVATGVWLTDARESIFTILADEGYILVGQAYTVALTPAHSIIVVGGAVVQTDEC